MKEKMTVFKSGGKRDEAGFNFHFFSLSPIALRRIAKIHFEGDTRYGFGNWRKGLPFSNLLNHAMNHLFLYLSGDTSQDNLGKAAWGFLAMMHLEETKPDCDDLKRVIEIDLAVARKMLASKSKKKRHKKKGKK